MIKRTASFLKKHVAVKISLIYAGFSALWILLSDQFLYLFVKDPQVMTEIQMVKGWVFILVTSLIIFSLLQREVLKYERTEAALRESEKKFRDLVNNSPDLMYRTDMEGRITYISPQVEGVSGYTAEEVLGKKMAEHFYVYPEQRNELMEKLRLNGYVRNFITCLKRKDGSTYWASSNAHFRKDPAGRIVGVEGVTRDVTEQKRAEAEKFEAQRTVAEQEKLVLVGRIAGKMAHDFNNVLGVIMGNTELAMLDCPDDETRKTLELIYEQTLRGKNLTKNLVAFAKNQEPRQEFFRINDTVDLVVSLLKKDLEGIEIVKEAGSGVPDLFADPGMIEHALINLLQNSIHALGYTENPRIVIRTYFSGRRICLEIEDNGCGIPEEYLHAIYEPSFTLKGGRDTTGAYRSDTKGTGYGMANVKKYIDQHKGEISVASGLNKGTRFTIRLPVIEKQLTGEEKREIEKQKVHSGRYILIVEDEPAISDMQYRVLTQDPCSHKVDVAANGKMALDLLQRNTYDLVSLDYVLIGDISGMDVYNHIREKDAQTPVLFISGNIEFLESIRDLKRKDPHVDHLSKPCRNRDYVNRINELIERSPAFPQ